MSMTNLAQVKNAYDQTSLQQWSYEKNKKLTTEVQVKKLFAYVPDILGLEYHLQ